jgi:hypothetical protein
MFTWIPIYKEIAESLRKYENKQKELIALLNRIKESGLPMISLEYMDEKRKRIPLTEIDPFTFFASFNRGIKDVNRVGIISFLKKEWSLSSEVPDDFSGIPVANNMNSWFFGFTKDRKQEDIPLLWKLFNEVLDDDLKEKTFNDALKIYGVSKNITWGMFWLKPEKYLNIDRVNIAHLVKQGVVVNFSDYASYMKILKEVSERIDQDFYQISFDAWQTGRGVKEEGGSEDDEETEREVIRDIKDVRIWMYAPGHKAKYWNECLEKKYMVFGADELDDLRTYKTREDIVKSLQNINKTEDSYKNDSLACWQFSREIKPGDIIIVKRGIDTYLGYGIVNGVYYYDKNKQAYRNIIPVNWNKKGEFKETRGPIVQKTLTDITRYREYIEHLVELLGIDFNIEKAIDKELEDLPLNLIIYGPPGTGKTYKILNEYIPRYFTTKKKARTKQEYIEEVVGTLSWFEVITLAMLDHEAVKVPELARHEAIEMKMKLSANNSLPATMWTWLQRHTMPECENVKYTQRSEPYIFWKNASSEWEIKSEVVAETMPDLIEIHRKINDYKAEEITEKRYELVTFHQSYSYEDFVEGIRPVQDQETERGFPEYRIEDGIFKRMAIKAKMNPEKKYALFIDEINRGNIAGIFGELITLIEKDKRETVEVVLPYSKTVFSVPKNLYIIGTMNTADRSIEALDTALRRRFSFYECKPDPSLLGQSEMPTVGIDLELLLEKINQRIEVLLDRDHTIGHSFFMKIENKSDPLEELKKIFENNIIPLLNEYFYNDRSKIKMVLGPAFVEEKAVNDDLFFTVDSEDAGFVEYARKTYEIKVPDTLEGFRSIYE